MEIMTNEQKQVSFEQQKRLTGFECLHSEEMKCPFMLHSANLKPPRFASGSHERRSRSAFQQIGSQ